jgi:RNA polymerase sigma factor (sigma-70 family)
VEQEHALERALDQVQDRCRRLIDLLYFDTNEPSYSQISQIMGMPEASIGPTRARCLEKLRKLLK